MRIKKYFAVALWFWATVAFYGFLLRWHAYTPLPFIKNYSYWLHAHSHAAFLGWLHAAFSLLIAYVLFPGRLQSKGFARYYAFMQLMVAAMLVSFPIEGYKAFSITFLSLFLLGTYIYAYYVFKRNEKAAAYPVTTAFVKTAVVFMLISSLSPWMLGPVMVFLGKNSIWYNLDVYFYLHFQYNGWFFLSLLALIIHLFERKGIAIPERVWKKSLFWLFTGIFWGYITNTLWTEPPLYFNAVALLSVVAEGAGLWILFRYLKKHVHALDLSRWHRRWFQWVVFAIIFKVVLQFTASCPYYARLAYTIRDLVIGYLHWVMLALFSVALILLAELNGIARFRKSSFWIFFSGMLLMILWIWMRGWMIWQKIPVTDAVNQVLVWLTLWTFTGVLLLAWDGSRNQ